MEDPRLSTNRVDRAAIYNYNLFKFMVAALLVAMLLGLWGRSCSFNNITAPTVSGPTERQAAGDVTLRGEGTPNSDVEVFLNGESVGRTIVQPDGSWSLEAAVSDGDYEAVAVAYDPDNGERGRSGGLDFTVGDLVAFEAPSLNLPDGDIDLDAITLSGSGTPGSMVEIFNNGESLGNAEVNADGSWTFTTSSRQYVNEFEALGLTPDGEEIGRSGISRLLLVNAAQAVSFDSAELGEVSAGDDGGQTAVLTLAGKGEPNSTIELTANGESIGTADVDADGNWRFSGPVALEPGSYTLGSRMVGLDGAELGSAERSGFDIPVLTSTAPDETGASEPAAAGGLTLDALEPVTDGSGGTVRLDGTATPNADVEIVVNGEVVETVTADADGNWTFAPSLPIGEYSISARLADDDAVVSDDRDVVVRAFVSSLDSEDVDDESGFGKKLTGFTLPNRSIDLLVNDEVVATEESDENGRFQFLLNLPEGDYQIATRLGDDSETTSEPFSLNFPPFVGITSVGSEAQDDDQGEVVISGRARPGSDVEIVIDDEIVGTATADADGNWEIRFLRPNGSYTVNARPSGAPADTLGSLRDVTVGTPTGTLALAYSGAAADGSSPGEAPDGGPAVEVILDASWSMTRAIANGQTRFDVAQASLQEIVANVLPDGTPFALRIFGNLEGNLACRTDLMVPYGELDRDAVANIVANAAPQFDANTPIAASLAAVADDLAASDEEERIVVLLTDGEETCDGDPGAEIERLTDLGINVQVNIVGLAIADEALKSQFEAWAALGNGSYYDVSDPSELSDALREAALLSYIVRDGDGNLVAIGRVGGAPVELPVGSYTVELLTSDRQMIENVEIVADETLSLTVE